jgi:hypothetical protein
VILSGAPQDPTHVCPPTAIAWRVRVAGTICVRVVYAVRHGPLNWSTLECDRAARHKKICNGFWNFISAMRQQPVKSHADAKTAANPVKYQRRDHSRPAPEKESGYRCYMRKNNKDSVCPINTKSFSCYPPLSPHV